MKHHSCNLKRIVKRSGTFIRIFSVAIYTYINLFLVFFITFVSRGVSVYSCLYMYLYPRVFARHVGVTFAKKGTLDVKRYSYDAEVHVNQSCEW